MRAARIPDEYVHAKERDTHQDANSVVAGDGGAAGSAGEKVVGQPQQSQPSPPLDGTRRSSNASSVASTTRSGSAVSAGVDSLGGAGSSRAASGVGVGVGGGYHQAHSRSHSLATPSSSSSTSSQPQPQQQQQGWVPAAHRTILSSTLMSQSLSAASSSPSSSVASSSSHPHHLPQQQQAAGGSTATTPTGAWLPSQSTSTNAAPAPPAGMTVRRAGGWRGGAAHASAGGGPRLSAATAPSSSATSSAGTGVASSTAAAAGGGVGGGAEVDGPGPMSSGSRPASIASGLASSTSSTSQAPLATASPKPAARKVDSLQSIPMMDNLADGSNRAANPSSNSAAAAVPSGATANAGPSANGPITTPPLQGWDPADRTGKLYAPSPPGVLAQLPPLTLAGEPGEDILMDGFTASGQDEDDEEIQKDMADAARANMMLGMLDGFCFASSPTAAKGATSRSSHVTAPGIAGTFREGYASFSPASPAPGGAGAPGPSRLPSYSAALFPDSARSDAQTSPRAKQKQRALDQDEGSATIDSTKAKGKQNGSNTAEGDGEAFNGGNEDSMELPLGAGQEGKYDWANFVFAYSRGRWDPVRLPRPPGLSSLYPGALSKIALTPAPRKVSSSSPTSAGGAGITVTSPSFGTHAQAQAASQSASAAMSNDQASCVATSRITLENKQEDAAAASGSENKVSEHRRPSLQYSDSSDGAQEEPSAASPTASAGMQAAPATSSGSTTLLKAATANAAASAASASTPSAEEAAATPTEALKVADYASTEAQKDGSDIEAKEGEQIMPELLMVAHRSSDSAPNPPTLATLRAGGVESGANASVPGAKDVQRSQTLPPPDTPKETLPVYPLEKKGSTSRTEDGSKVNKSVPAGLRLDGNAVDDQEGENEDEDAPAARPQPTPIQSAPTTSHSEPAYGWNVTPEGTSSTFAEMMIRKASENNHLDANSLFVAESVGESSTLEGLRRAARRASFERQAAKLPLKDAMDGNASANEDAALPALSITRNPKLPPHSLSFPPDVSKLASKPMTGPDGVLSVTEAKVGLSGAAASTASWGPMKTAETVQPEREEPPSFLRSSAGEAQQKESALQGLMASANRATRAKEEVASDDLEKVKRDFDAGSNTGDAPPRLAGTKRRSSVDETKFPSGTPTAATFVDSATAAASGSSNSVFNSYMAAGRRAEQFFRENGYLPSIHPPNELERRKALRRYGPPMLSGNANFDRITHLVKLVFNTQLVLISFVGEREQIFRSEAGGPSGLSPGTLQKLAKSRDCSFCGHTILQNTDEPVVVLDAKKDWRFAGNPFVTGLPNIRFYAGSPLRTADGFNIGSLCIIDDQPREEFNPRQRHTLREFARIVMREMELLRDRMHFDARDRMQHSIENFTRGCLEMDMEESTEGQVEDAQGARRIYALAAENMQSALQANGAVVFDLSHFELIESFPPDSDDASTKIFFPSPYSQPDLKPYASAEKPDQVDVVDSPFWDRSNKDGALKSKLVPPMVVLGASEDLEPPRQRGDPVPLSHHVQVAQFLRAHPGGRFYPYTPTPLRHLLPDGISRLLVVPIFGLNRQPFALLCTYSISSEEGGALEELKDTGLQYLRAIGMIILSAVLRKDIMLADKAKSHFISNISHELRTPLHGILAAAELLTETRLSSTQSSYLDTIEACGRSLLELVNHVLDFTKLSGSSRSKGVPLHTKTKCDLVRLVQEVCESSWIGQMAKNLEMQSNSGIGSFYAPPSDDLKPANANALPHKLSNNDVETVIEVSFREEGWLVNCDTGGIRRVLMNLIGNSLKFTSAGFVHVSLRELSSTDSHVIVELGVTDTGRGISRHFLEEQLFHPFTQENTLGTGTGLGLSIVNSIVQSPAMNGKIDVWSTEGQGTEIKVTCELEKAESGDLEGAIYVSSLDVAGSSSVSLLGFGETRGQQDLKEVLLGYLCGWWKFALAEESTSTPGDLVIINEDLTILQELQARKSSPLPPVIILTSSRGGQEIAAACDKYHAAGGVARILFKPAGPAKLEAVVDFCLQCIERVRQGKPPLDIETKADTPLPSPAAPLLSVKEEEKQDYFTLESHSGAPGDADATPQSVADLTPKGMPSSGQSSSSGHFRSGSKHDGFYMTPPVPTANANASLIRRHSAEDKSRSGKVLDHEADAKRPLMPARSITYHEPRLHKHVLLSPLGRDRHGEEHGDYFAYSHGGSNSSPSSTPGSTVSLEGGEGAILKNVVHSTRNTGPGGSKKRLQILSVEDNAINRKVIAAFLDKINVDFVEAVNGEEGVKLFEAHPPNHFDVILMDLSMPVLDGIGATAAIRRVEAERYTASLAPSAPTTSASSSSVLSSKMKGGLKHPSPRNRVKIFALTGRSSDEDKRMAFATGADGYIVKPLSFKVLSSLLKMLSR